VAGGKEKRRAFQGALIVLGLVVAEPTDHLGDLIG